MKAYIFKPKSNNYPYTTFGVICITIYDYPPFDGIGSPIEVSVPRRLRAMMNDFIEGNVLCTMYIGCGKLYESKYGNFVTDNYDNIYVVYSLISFMETNTFKKYFIGNLLLIQEQPIRIRKKQ